MWLSDTAVKRPVLASIMSLLLLIFGLMSFERMSVQEYPNIDRSAISISTAYVGASASVVESRITKIIESAVAGISGISSISSSSTDGRSRVSIEFNLNQNIEEATNEIRDKISRISNRLPDQAGNPSIRKVRHSTEAIIWFNLSSDKMTISELTDYAERYLVDRFSILPGVARVRIGGGQSFALRIWLDPRKMMLYKLSAAEIERQIRSANVEVPIGYLQGEDIVLTLQAEKPLQTIKEFKNLIIKQTNIADNISQVRLSDVAEVTMGAVESRRYFTGNGLPSVGIGIIKKSTASTLAVAKEAFQLKETINKTLPDGLTMIKNYDASVFVKKAVSEVYKTLFIALGLVVLVLLLFLKNIRAAFIPAITLPIAIIATFWVLWLLGLSINLLTLLAFVLAVGLVVDDSIVVLENIQRYLDKGYKANVAAYLGTRQVGFAVIATTIVLIAVFMPIAFLEGRIGKLFAEFAITLAVAVIFSSWVALTLSPALASKLLKPKAISANKKRPSQFFKKLLIKNFRLPWLGIIIFFSVIFASIFYSQDIKQEYIPKEDRGSFSIMVKGPEGASFNYMQSYMAQIENRLLDIMDEEGIRRVVVRSPRGFGDGDEHNSGIVRVMLNDWSERESIFKIVQQVRKELDDLAGISSFITMTKGLGGRSQKSIQFVVGGSTYEELAEWKEILNQELATTNPGLTRIRWDYEPNKPQLKLKIDYQKTTLLGISHQNITETLQLFLGSKRVTTFQFEGKEYDIVIKADPSLFQSPKDLEEIYIYDNNQRMIPLSELISLKEVATDSKLNRYNRIRSFTLSAKLQENYSLGEALGYLNTLVKEKLPAHATIDYKGQSKDFQSANQSIIFMFALAIAIVFLVLAAQFESFIQPFIIMLTVPLAFAGGIFAMQIHGISLNIYSQIALVILLGIATKNGILIVEFTNQYRDKGLSLYYSLIAATQLRLRPIMMSAITTCVGTIPLILSEGAGSEVRQVVGYVLFWGIIFSTLLSLFIIPLAYGLLAKNTSSPQSTSQFLKRELQKIK